MPSWICPSRSIRSPTCASRINAAKPCSSTPARMRPSTCSRVCFSRTTVSMPRRRRSWDKSSPEGPPPMMPTWVFIAGLARRFNSAPVRSPCGLGLLAGVGHVLELVELDVPQLATLLLDAAHIDRLHDVARLRVDGDGAAGTLRLPALDDIHRLVRIDLA